MTIWNNSPDRNFRQFWQSTWFISFTMKTFFAIWSFIFLNNKKHSLIMLHFFYYHRIISIYQSILCDINCAYSGPLISQIHSCGILAKLSPCHVTYKLRICCWPNNEDPTLPYWRIIFRIWGNSWRKFEDDNSRAKLSILQEL